MKSKRAQSDSDDDSDDDLDDVLKMEAGMGFSAPKKSMKSGAYRGGPPSRGGQMMYGRGGPPPMMA